MTITNRFSLLLTLGLVLVLGCSSSKTTVARISGSVKYKGAPVTAGTITFTAKAGGKDAGGTYMANINSDGTYSNSELPAGDFEVAIETETANPNRPNASQYGGGRGKEMNKASPMPEGVGANAAAKGPYVKIPAKYANPKTSGLTATLTNGKNTKDFDLTD